MKFIYNYKSPNFDKRKKGTALKYIILHYTAMRNYKEAINHLCSKKNKVSSHFVISKKGEVFYLVDISKRAWHCGLSYWTGVTDVNSESVGIEIDNSGYHYNFEKFETKQIESLISLIRYIFKQYMIKEKCVLGHSDISPYRKIDPGTKFPWKSLSKRGISFFPSKLSDAKLDKVEEYLDFQFKNNNKYSKSLYMLNKIGYDTEPAKKDPNNYKLLIKAYQMHYRQNLISGKLDKETYNLIQSHFNEMLT